ncbi:acyl-CoA dehydrogenase family protein [Ideonella sp. DXS29W]|uniref:Acyl-CoA dehydrogenase family protein n=1 Tax=Ideonella lacteola TaxID=2984193 RepID=A0ABU9BRV7_9BURK
MIIDLPEQLATHQENGHHPDDALAACREVTATLARTAAERDLRGGTPKAERDLLRRSGLLKLIIPTHLGGHGADWTLTLRIVREIAAVDSSLAHVFAFQHLLLATTRLFGTPDQYESWMAHTASRDWFWGNALNPLDKRTLHTPRPGGGLEFHGHKSFCSGAVDSDMLIASAVNAEGRMLIAAIPTQRSGITIHGDWDNMGQRQTDSGSATFDHVHVRQEELLIQPGPFSSPFASLRSLIAQLILTNIYVGLAEGALLEARRYTHEHARLWFASTAQRVEEDQYVLGHYGEFWAALEGARVLADRAAAQLDAAWAQGLALSAEERGDVALGIATAKVAATRTGLELTSRMFEVAGARATSNALRLDRFWRNLRTHTLHDPLDYKLRELGDWALNDKRPQPTFYS